MAKPAYYSLNQYGSSGPDVGLIQTWLDEIRTKWTSIIALTVDGKFGSNTEKAVKQFQTIVGLTADGEVGNNTWNGLYGSYAAMFAPIEQYPGVLIEYGTKGATVKSAQTHLTAKGYPLTADGEFGSKTQSATKSFQQAHGLSADGIIGPNTWAKLYA